MSHLHLTAAELAKIQARIKAASPKIITAAPFHSASSEAKTAIRQGLSKYRNVKIRVDGILFDSKREAARYGELKLLETSGEISDLELQPGFICYVNGKRICKYFADFGYKNKGGQRVIEDAKAIRTAVYQLKKRLVKALHGVDIVEV
jgi:hypothetical protein